MSDTPEDAPRPMIHSGRAAAYVVPLLLAIVVGGGLGLRNYPEFFPFATWAMFSRVPAQYSFHTLRVQKLHGKPVDGETLITRHPLFQARFNTSATARLIQRFAKEVAALPPDAPLPPSAQAMRRLLEGKMQARRVEYELVRLNGNPMELAKDISQAREKSVRTFVKDTP